MEFVSDDVLTKICSYLDISEINIFSGVSQKIRQMILSSSLWKIRCVATCGPWAEVLARSCEFENRASFWRFLLMDYSNSMENLSRSESRNSQKTLEMGIECEFRTLEVAISADSRFLYLKFLHNNESTVAFFELCSLFCQKTRTLEPFCMHKNMPEQFSLLSGTHSVTFSESEGSALRVIDAVSSETTLWQCHPRDTPLFSWNGKDYFHSTDSEDVAFLFPGFLVVFEKSKNSHQIVKSRFSENVWNLWLFRHVLVAHAGNELKFFARKGFLDSGSFEKSKSKENFMLDVELATFGSLDLHCDSEKVVEVVNVHKTLTDDSTVISAVVAMGDDLFVFVVNLDLSYSSLTSIDRVKLVGLDNFDGQLERLVSRCGDVLAVVQDSNGEFVDLFNLNTSTKTKKITKTSSTSTSTTTTPDPAENLESYELSAFCSFSASLDELGTNSIRGLKLLNGGGTLLLKSVQVVVVYEIRGTEALRVGVFNYDGDLNLGKQLSFINHYNEEETLYLDDDNGDPSACWSPCGRFLVTVHKESPQLRVADFSHGNFFPYALPRGVLKNSKQTSTSKATSTNSPGNNRTETAARSLTSLVDFELESAPSSFIKRKRKSSSLSNR